MKLILITLVAVVVGMMVGCTMAPATPANTPNIDATVEAKLQATIAAMPTPTPIGLSSEDCASVFHWREAVQEYYFDINTRDVTELIWAEETIKSFYEVAKLTLPSSASKPNSELLPLLELHTAEIEEIVWEIADSGGNALLTKEPELLEANKTIRKINNLLVQECQFQPLILYEPHPKSSN